MSRKDHNRNRAEEEPLNTEPIHGASPKDKSGDNSTPSDATLPSDEPQMLAQRESGKVVKICKTCMVSQRDGGSFCVDCGSELVPIRSVQDSCIGDVVGDKFTIVEKIGSGGMGDVYRGINEPIDQQVAIKFLNEKFTSDEKIVLRFLNEARSYCKVNHPNAVTLLEYGQHDDGSLYLITEFIEGDDLTEVVRREGPLPTETIVAVGVQMCEVLSAAHNQGIIHRDLKPDNLMLISGSRGRYAVKVLDFGIAKIADDDRTGPMTETGSVFGTPEFMSPEQARGETADPRSDLYALGAILYYMATGKLPFRGKNKFTILNRQLNEAPQAPSKAADGVEVHPELEKIILQCLEKSPEDRPSKADEVAEALEAIDLRSETRRTAANTAPSHRPAKVDDTVREDNDQKPQDVLDGPAADGQLPDTVSMSTFDDAADEALDIRIDDDSHVDPLGVTLDPNAEDDDGIDDGSQWEDSLDTDAPDGHVGLQSIKGKPGSRRRPAMMGAVASILLLGGLLIFWSDGDDSPVETTDDGLSTALSIIDDGRMVALLESTEAFVDQGRFSDADATLEYFDGLSEADSSHRERYDDIVARASRAQNLEMRIRSQIESGNCERASELHANLARLSKGAGKAQSEIVQDCSERGATEVAEAPSEPSPRQPDAPREPSAPPAEPAPTPKPQEVQEQEEPESRDDAQIADRDPVLENPEETSEQNPASAEESGADDEEIAEEPEETPTEEPVDTDTSTAEDEGQEAEVAEEDDEETDSVGGEADDVQEDDDDDDVVLPPSEI